MARRKRAKAKAKKAVVEDSEEIDAVIEEIDGEEGEAAEMADQEEAAPPQEMSEEDREEAMANSAKTVVRSCMQIYRHENVLVIADPTTSAIGEALYLAASEVSNRVLMVMMPKGKHHGDEPPTPVASLMTQQDVIMAPTRYSITHTKARMQATRANARIATMPGMTVKMFTEGGMTADFGEIKSKISEMYGLLRRKKQVQLTAPGGTDVSFDVNWREWNLDDSGICNRPGMVTNLPAGKVFCSPREGSMNGRIVIDGSWDATELDEPLTLEIEGGSIVDVLGGSDAAELRQVFRDSAAKLKSKDRDAVWNVSEFGFGMNPAASIIGSVLEDEKTQGTAYFGVGDAGGSGLKVGFHLTGVIRDPTIRMDELDIMIDGEIQE